MSKAIAVHFIHYDSQTFLCEYNVDATTTHGALRAALERHLSISAEWSHLCGSNWYYEKKISVHHGTWKRNRQTKMVSKLHEYFNVQADKNENCVKMFKIFDINYEQSPILLYLNGIEFDVKTQYTNLWDAAEHGEVIAIDWLIANGADPNNRNFDGLTPLHIAAQNGHDAAVCALIGHGADVNHKAERHSQNLPLHLAARNARISTIKILLDHGSSVRDIGEGPLHHAAASGNVVAIDLLIANGACVHALADNQMTPLHVAAKYGHVGAITNLLTEHKAAIHAVSGEEGTPLHVAAANGHLQAIEALVAHGAHVNFSQYGCCLYRTPLHIAALHDKPDAIAKLFDLGADLSILATGSTAMHLAAKKGHVEALRVLLAHGADPDELESDQTSLHFAAQNDDEAVAEVLVWCGADVDAKSTSGHTPLYMAAMSAMGRRACVYRLLAFEGAMFGSNCTEAIQKSMKALLKRFLV